MINLVDTVFGIEGHPLAPAFSVKFQAGECWALLGKNGSGKTQLLKSLAGLMPLMQGSVFIDDTNIDELNEQQRAKLRAYLPQHPLLPEDECVSRVASYGNFVKNAGWSTWRQSEDSSVINTLKKLDLYDIKDRLIGLLSGGEKQRTALATSLIQSTQNIILDEPLNHLDLSHQHQILTHLKNLCAQHAKFVIFSTHDINTAARYSTHCILLQKGLPPIMGKSAEVLTSNNLSNAFEFPIEKFESRSASWFSTVD